MTEFIILAVLCLIVIGCLVAWVAYQSKQWQEERREMLNRIMARDYREFVSNEPKEMKVVPLDELRRELQSEEGQPLGMPV